MKIEKKTMQSVCWKCSGRGCKECKYTGKCKESMHYITYEQNGKIYCIDSDNIG